MHLAKPLSMIWIKLIVTQASLFLLSTTNQDKFDYTAKNNVVIVIKKVMVLFSLIIKANLIEITYEGHHLFHMNMITS